MSKPSISTAVSGDHRLSMVVAVVLVQAVAAVFFLADAAVDFSEEGWGLHVVSEAIIAFALFAGVALGAWLARGMIEQARRDAAALTVARGAVADLLATRFREWDLTDAECEVALFALKGCEVPEIATLRGTAEGTVRAQLTSIYAKSGVSSRHALLSQFFDELIEAGMG